MMNRTRSATRSYGCLIVLLLSSWILAQDEPYLGPANLSAAVSVAQVQHTDFDIGGLAAVFDGDPHTLVRTPAVNPLEITVAFPEPVRAYGFRLLFNHEEHQVRIEAGASAEELVELVPLTHVSGEGIYSIRFPEPVEYRVYRLVARRLTGDDYVHLYEWEFLRPVTLGALTITAREEGEFLTNIKTDTLPEDLTHPCLIRLRALAALGDLPPRDVTGEAEWSVDPGGVLRPGSQPGQFWSLRSGRTTVRAVFHGREAAFPVELGQRVLANREPDLDVALIERFPKFTYDGPRGCPEAGEPVTFRAKIIWWGRETVEKVGYRWRIDGEEVGSGSVSRLLPLDRVQVEYGWNWQPGRHRVTFEIDPDDDIEELTEDNNAVTDYTDALTVAFWVDQQVYDRLHELRYRLVGEGNSFEDWAQHLIRRWNAMLAAAVYPSTPQGVLDRVRLDKVVVVPTDALPRNGGIPTNNPDTRDRTVDLMWGFPTRDLRNGGWPEDPEGWIKEDLGVLHELSHARYLVDSYGFDVHAKGIHITDEEGHPIANSRYLPGDMPHARKYEGQMGGDYGKLSEYEALAWNWKAGQRANGSPCNAPPDIGNYLQLMPERNVFQFVDEQDSPLAGAELWVYRARGNGKDWYAKEYDDEPDLKGTLDDQGSIALGRDLFGGEIIHTFGHSNAVLILRIRHAGRLAYLFQEVSDLNIEYMKGNRRRATYRRVVVFPQG